MPQFDPRRSPVRLIPRLVMGAAGLGALYLAWQSAQPTAVPEMRKLSAGDYAELEHRAFAAAEVRPGYAAPETVPVKVRSGETLQAAVERTGVGEAEARMVVNALAQAVDTTDIKAGLSFEAAVAEPRTGRDRVAGARLIGLSMRTGPATAITLSRTFDGALRLRELEETVIDEVKVAQGTMDGSLYASATRAGADARITGEVVKLFAHKIDFGRDIKSGDPFRLVFDRKVTESGRLIETGELLYAELEAKGKKTAFYRFDRGGRTEWLDEFGKNIRGFLLRTPVDGARVTSNFGMRRHPILGYSKMHQGIDFGASSGTPVYAAGDGVVVEARRWGGYGNWVRVRHGGGWETGYAHLSSYARGLKPGMAVRQGQVIAYVGSTGASTGPHLHYETWFKGQRINPVGAKVPQGTVLVGAELARFQAQKARIDAMIAEAGDGSRRLTPGETPTVQQASLRGAVDVTGAERGSL